MTEMVYIGLGSNLGDRAANLRAAVEALNAHPGIATVRVSAFYETVPLGNSPQPAYLNAAAQIQTSLEPTALLAVLQVIENRLGRRRVERWHARTIDLDVLLYGRRVIRNAKLTVPHPQMHLRSFVLKGLCELNGDVIHPVLGRTASQLYERLNGQDFYRDPARPQLISIAGLIGVGKTTLAGQLAEGLKATVIREKYDDNPYLPEVYAGNKNVVLDSELFFLSSSAAQLRRDRLKPGQGYISDYVFDKALVYASSWLDAEELDSYKRHYACVVELVAKPTVVIYLNDTVQACLDRIHRRNRPYEQHIEPFFLNDLKQKYDALYANWMICPVIRLDAGQCALPEQAAAWAEEIRHYTTL